MEKGTATHFWPWEFQGQRSLVVFVGSQRVGHDWSNLACKLNLRARIAGSLLPLSVCVCVCVCESLSCVWLLLLYCPWGFQAGTLGWAAIFLLQGISRSRDGTCVFCVSCIGRRILYPLVVFIYHRINTQMFIIYNTGKYEIISLYKFFFAVWYLWILNSQGVISERVSWYFVICKLWLYYLKKIQYLEIII